METLALTKLIETDFEDGFTYETYRKKVTDLLASDQVTGHTQSADLVEYTKLNQRRMKRWEKTLKVPAEVKEKVSNISHELYFLVLSEGWCGDAAHNLPVIKKVADLNEHISMRIVLRDDHDALMSAFLTNGGKSIPKLIVYDPHEKTVKATWGPRPEAATGLVNDYKEKHGGIDQQIKEDLQHWYNADKGQSAFYELAKIV